MPSTKVIHVTYRSRLKTTGQVFTESESFNEVVVMSRGEDVLYEQQVISQVTSDWTPREPTDPDHVYV